MKTDEPRLPEQPSGQYAIAPFKPFQLPPPAAPTPSAVLPALGAIVLTVAICAGLISLSTKVLGQYGLVTYSGVPLLAGLLATLLHNLRRPRSLSDALRASLWVVGWCVGLVSLLLLLALGPLGLVYGLGYLCLFLPAALPSVVLGGFCGHVLLMLVRWYRYGNK